MYTQVLLTWVNPLNKHLKWCQFSFCFFAYHVRHHAHAGQTGNGRKWGSINFIVLHPEDIKIVIKKVLIINIQKLLSIEASCFFSLMSSTDQNPQKTQTRVSFLVFLTSLSKSVLTINKQAALTLTCITASCLKSG